MTFLKNQLVSHLVNILHGSPQYAHVVGKAVQTTALFFLRLPKSFAWWCTAMLYLQMDFLTQQARASPSPVPDFTLLLRIMAGCFMKMGRHRTRSLNQEMSCANLDRKDCSGPFTEGHRLLQLLDSVAQLQMQQKQDVNLFPAIESALLELFQAIGKRGGCCKFRMSLSLSLSLPLCLSVSLSVSLSLYLGASSLAGSDFYSNLLCVTHKMLYEMWYLYLWKI